MHQNCNNTPLIWASRYGHIKMVERLLEAKAQIEVQEVLGNSPLILAAMAPGDAGLGAAALLLDAKAAIDHQRNSGGTALQAACECSNVEVAKLLLERGADQRLRGNLGEAPAYAERAVRKEEMLALLARHA